MFVFYCFYNLFLLLFLRLSFIHSLPFVLDSFFVFSILFYFSLLFLFFFSFVFLNLSLNFFDIRLFLLLLLLIFGIPLLKHLGKESSIRILDCFIIHAPYDLFSLGCIENLSPVLTLQVHWNGLLI
jgi:hypothetical protein